MKYQRQRYLGKCSDCGSEFRTFVEIATLPDGHRAFRPAAHLSDLTLSRDETFFTCTCPSCGEPCVELHEI